MEVFKSFESFLKFEPFLFPSLLLSIRCSQYPFQRGARIESNGMEKFR